MVPGGSGVVVACGVGVRPGVGGGIGVSAGIKVVELTPHAVITKRIDRTTIAH